MNTKNDALTSEDAKMNMTPMIDMTFLLVVFFMLTIDLSKKEFEKVQLPYARSGIEDDPSMKVDGQSRFVVNLLDDGTVKFKGKSFELSDPDPTKADAAIQELKRELRKMHEERGEVALEPDGASKIPVLIHADRKASWKFVQWIMQVGADQSIKIYKVQFSVKHPPEEGAEPGAPAEGDAPAEGK